LGADSGIWGSNPDVVLVSHLLTTSGIYANTSKLGDGAEEAKILSANSGNLR